MSSQHRGTGNVYQPTYRDERTDNVRTAAGWWVCWSYRGRIYRQSSHSTNRADAIRLLKKKLGEAGLGRVHSLEVEHTSLEDLCKMLLDDSRANRRRSLERIGAALAHLPEHFGRMRPVT
jgi:hypothetical protein